MTKDKKNALKMSDGIMNILFSSYFVFSISSIMNIYILWIKKTAMRKKRQKM